MFVKLGMISFLLSLLFLLNACGSAPSKESTAACNLAPSPGPCKAAIPKYYFNQKIQSCSSFQWGGCKGTVPFEDLNLCQATCETKKYWFQLF